MSFFKTHLPPTLHNAAGTLIASAILAILAVLVVFIKQIRDLSVPIWMVLILFSVLLAVVAIYIRTKNQKHAEAVANLNEKQSEEILALNSAADAKIASAKAEAEHFQDILMPKFPPPGSPIKPPKPLGKIDPYSK